MLGPKLRVARTSTDVKMKLKGKKMAKKKSFRKLLAAAFALTLVGGLGAGGAANAAPTAPWAEGAPDKGSIEIVKTDDKNNNKPVEGAGFTVTQVTKIGNDDVNTTTYAGWENIAKNIDAMNKGTVTVTLGTAQSEKKTGADGKVKFADLPVGLYQVEETTIPAGHTVDVKKFYMTIPEITGTDSTNLTYNYDVTVNPKNVNESGNVTKSDPSGTVVGAGANASYTVTAKLNKSKGTEQSAKDLTKADIQNFAIFDDVQVDAFGNPTAAVVGDVKVGGAKLTLNDDYNVTVKADPDGAGYGPGTRTRVQVTFTEAGLTKIAAAANAAAGTNVEVTAVFNLKLKDDLSGAMKDKNGNVVVINKYGFIPGNGEGENPSNPVVPNPGKPDPDKPGPGDPTMKFGDFQIKKTDATDKTALKDAEFIAFAKKADADNCVKSDDRSNCAGVATEYGTKPTDTNGKTDAYKAKVGQEFYVVEKKAPSGYILSNNVTAVTVTAGSNVYETGITNVRTKDSGKWFNLPRTGAIGVGIFALLGAGLVAGGTAMHVRSRRGEDA